MSSPSGSISWLLIDQKIRSPAEPLGFWIMGSKCVEIFSLLLVTVEYSGGCVSIAKFMMIYSFGMVHFHYCFIFLPQSWTWRHFGCSHHCSAIVTKLIALTVSHHDAYIFLPWPPAWWVLVAHHWNSQFMEKKALVLCLISPFASSNQNNHFRLLYICSFGASCNHSWRPLMPILWSCLNGFLGNKEEPC